ncbi:MAG: DegT/DnrJ/EryC1/StrS family aminotransferase [Methanosarcinales archaeon]
MTRDVPDLVLSGQCNGVYYQIPIHKHPLYQKLGYKDNLPVSEKVAKQVISLQIRRLGLYL